MIRNPPAELAHPPVAPDRERHEERHDSYDPAERASQRVRYAASERERARRLGGYPGGSATVGDATNRLASVLGV